MMIPKEVCGRPVTKRGVHLHATGHHGFWLERAEYWVDLLQSMGMSWAVLLSDSDGAMVPQAAAGGRSAIEVLLDGGIIPVIRFVESNLPRHFEHMDHVVTAVRQYDPYGVTPIFQWPNEPGNGREWVNEVPDNWREIFFDRWLNFCRLVIERGGIAGFPDGPCYDEDPFPRIESTWPWWEDGKCIYLGHFYGLNRPPDYPYDPIQREGLQWSEDDLRQALGQWYDEPAFNDVPLEVMNRKRIEQMSPSLTAIDDDTCWRGFEKIEHWMGLNFGHVLPMALTEGGWTPGARAGGGSNAELRYPKPTPETVADYTLRAFGETTPMLFQCPWLVASGDMGMDDDWPFDAWHGWAYPEAGSPDCPRCKPVMRILQDNPANGAPTARGKIGESKGHIDRADNSLGEALELMAPWLDGE